MRSAGGTKSGELALVTFATNSVMDCLALPSFHEGSGSAARAMVVLKASTQAGAAAMRFRRCMLAPFYFLGILVRTLPSKSFSERSPRHCRPGEAAMTFQLAAK